MDWPEGQALCPGTPCRRLVARWSRPAAQAAKELHTLRENEDRFRKAVRVGVQLATGGRAPVVFAPN